MAVARPQSRRDRIDSHLQTDLVLFAQRYQLNPADSQAVARSQMRDLDAFVVDEGAIRALQVADLEVAARRNGHATMHTGHQRGFENEVRAGGTAHGLDAAWEDAECLFGQLGADGAKNPHRLSHGRQRLVQFDRPRSCPTEDLIAPLLAAVPGADILTVVRLVSDTHFKGWAKPGPLPPSASSPVDVMPEETLDASSGHFRIFQLRKGHRFSTDDVLTAWYGSTWVPTASRVLDLGSGIGSVATIAAWRLPGATLVTIEAQEASVALARKSMAYNGLTARVDVRHADFRDPGALAHDEPFDLVLGSPPYFPADAGVHGDHPQKVACRFELRGDIADYARVAGTHLRAGGVFACVFPEEQRARLEAAATAAAMVVVRRRPVVFKEHEPALVTLFVLMRAVDLPEHMRTRTWVEPPLVIRAADGSVHPEYAAVKLAFGFPP